MRPAPRLSRKDKKQFAKSLRNNLPHSERWFFTLYNKHYRIMSDQSNLLFDKYIPDIINKEFKYIIEVDGSIHDLAWVKRKDAKKTKRYTQLGYRVFRVKHGSIRQYIELIDELVKIRGHISLPGTSYADLKFKRHSNPYISHPSDEL